MCIRGALVQYQLWHPSVMLISPPSKWDNLLILKSCWKLHPGKEKLRQWKVSPSQSCQGYKKVSSVPCFSVKLVGSCQNLGAIGQTPVYIPSCRKYAHTNRHLVI
ncbi:hypothetical protein Ancab_010859 [Ancistrocladus abbreviatus]